MVVVCTNRSRNFIVWKDGSLDEKKVNKKIEHIFAQRMGVDTYLTHSSDPARVDGTVPPRPPQIRKFNLTSK